MEIELARLQSHVERWSEDLDGEKGMIREWRDHQAERRMTLGILKGVAWVLGPATVVQVVLMILQISKTLQH